MSVIIEQGALVRRLRTDGPHQAQYEEAVARLQSLKQEFQEVSGRLWLHEIREAVNKLRSLLSEAILAQSSLVLLYFKNLLR